MDRVSASIGRAPDNESFDDNRAFTLPCDEESLVQQGGEVPSAAEDLFRLNELDVFYDEGQRALWSFMRSVGRPSFTQSLLRDFEDWQRLIPLNFGPERKPLDYLILGSRTPDVFCFGGDLQLFQSLIRAGDRDGLVRYGYRCVEILDRNIAALQLPMLTIGLVEGAALGGGFEALLSFDFIIAERTATFGLPEIMFNLFPGMGAHAFLIRKLGLAQAERIILSNQTYSAQDMFDLGIVHQVVEPGEGRAACEEFMAKADRRHSALVRAKAAARVTAPVPLAELKAIVDLWADTALELADRDLKIMSRLVAAQGRLKASA
ncbi:MAG: crotonase/enoyl-CoA hydratase family protein [Novosphingobium sp.]|nr:crotonase/enoyl-CoA hydratase family protein [Novosphingobium sp.]